MHTRSRDVLKGDAPADSESKEHGEELLMALKEQTCIAYSAGHGTGRHSGGTAVAARQYHRALHVPLAVS